MDFVDLHVRFLLVVSVSAASWNGILLPTWSNLPASSVTEALRRCVLRASRAYAASFDICRSEASMLLCFVSACSLPLSNRLQNF